MLFLQKYSLFLRKTVGIISAIVLVFVSSGVVNIAEVQAVSVTWYSTSWLYRMPLTIDHTKVAGDLTNFSVLVSITKTDLQKAQADGDDLLFTAADGTTKLDHDSESWDGSTGKLIAWVRVPMVSSVTDTVLYLYYGNSAATSQQNKTGAWSNNFRLVQHMESDVTHTDASGNGNNGTVTGAPTAVAAQIGQGNHFDGVDDAVIVPDNASLNFTD